MLRAGYQPLSSVVIPFTFDVGFGSWKKKIRSLRQVLGNTPAAGRHTIGLEVDRSSSGNNRWVSKSNIGHEGVRTRIKNPIEKVENRSSFFWIGHCIVSLSLSFSCVIDCDHRAVCARHCLFMICLKTARKNVFDILKTN